VSSIPQKKGYLQQLAAEQGVSVEELVVRAVKREGTAQRAAKKLGVTRQTVRYGLLQLGYEAGRKTVVWSKEQQS